MSSSREWRKRNPERWAQLMRRHHYGIEEPEFQALLTAQGGRCAICREQFAKTPSVDHDHVTKRIRGLLCRNCNCGIGLLKDSPLVLRAAAEYLEKWR